MLHSNTNRAQTRLKNHREAETLDQNLGSLRLPKAGRATSPSSSSDEAQPTKDRPSKLDRFLGHAKAFSLTALRLLADALLWSGGKLQELARSFLQQPKPQGPVETLITRATSGPPDNWKPATAHADRSWKAVAKESSLAVLSFVEPSFLKETRKLMSYEQGILKKVSAACSQVAQGLPNRAGTHISPERIRALPFQYNDPHLQRTFHQLRREHFPNRHDLDDYKVVWRDRPMRTAQGNGALNETLGYIEYGTRTIHVAREMSHADAKKWIPALIHHELSHAVLGGFLSSNQDAHAEWFRRLNELHPDTKEFERWGGWNECFRSYHQQG